MKKILSIICTVVVIFSMVGCGREPEETKYSESIGQTEEFMNETHSIANETECSVQGYETLSLKRVENTIKDSESADMLRDLQGSVTEIQNFGSNIAVMTKDAIYKVDNRKIEKISEISEGSQSSILFKDPLGVHTMSVDFKNSEFDMHSKKTSVFGISFNKETDGIIVSTPYGDISILSKKDDGYYLRMNSSEIFW